NHRDETRAGFEVWIVKLAIALVLLKMCGVFRRQERALMMIEPPGDLRRAGVLEIHDSVLVAIELLFIEQSAGTVQQPGKYELRLATHALPVKTGEQSGR